MIHILKELKIRNSTNYLCTIKNNDGNVCTTQKVYREDGQCFCTKHFKSYSLFKNGIATQRSDTDIYHRTKSRTKSTARDYYDELIDTYHKQYWAFVESKDAPLNRRNCYID